jgi:selenoprotein W-related protein
MLRHHRRPQVSRSEPKASEDHQVGRAKSIRRSAVAGPVIEIVYCTRCRWLLRAAWIAQELLGTFEADLGGVTLVPNAEGGVFELRLAGERIFSRAEAGGFPEIKALKQLVRDRVAPGRDLGHIDR